MLPSNLVIILRRSFCSWKKPDCVPDLSGHWVPQFSPWKCLRLSPYWTSSSKHGVWSLRSSVHASRCCSCPQLGSFSLEQDLLVSSLWWEMCFGGEMRPALHYCITLSRSAVGGVLECSSWKGNRAQAGKGRWSLLWVWTQVPTQTLSVCTAAAVLAARTGMTGAPRKAGVSGYDPRNCVEVADCGLDQFLAFTKVSAAPSPAVPECHPLVFPGFP